MAQVLLFELIVQNDKSIKSMQDLIDRQKELKKQIKEATNVGDKEYKELQANISGNQKAIRQFNRELNGSKSLTKSVTDGMIASFKRLGGVILAAFSFQKVVQGFNFVITATKEFEAQIDRVGAISGATAEELDVLEKAAKDMGESTVFSATQAAEAMESLAVAGFSTTEIIEALPGVLNLAAAGGIELSEAADIAASTLKAFGFEASEVNRVNDAIVATFTKSNVTIESFKESIKLVAPVAAGLGITLEETSAAIGKLGDVGLKGSIAGSALRSAFAKLLTPVGKSKEALDRLGLSFDENFIKTEGLTGVIKGLEDSGASVTDILQIFGTQAGPAISALVQQGSDSLAELTQSIEDSGGIAESIAEQQLDNFQGSLTLLGSASEGLAIEIGQVLVPVLRGLVDGLTNAIGFLGDLPNFIERNQTAFTLLGVAVVALNRNLLISTARFIGNKVAVLANVIATKAAAVATRVFSAAQAIMGTVIGVASGKIKIATIAQKALNLAMKANPIGLIIAAITALAAAYSILNSKSEEQIRLEKAFVDISKQVADAVQAEVAGLQRLVFIAEDRLVTDEQRAKALAKIVEEYGPYLTEQEKEKVLLGELEGLQRILTERIVARAVTTAIIATQQEALNEAIDASIKAQRVRAGLLDDEVGLLDKLKASVIGFGVTASGIAAENLEEDAQAARDFAALLPEIADDLTKTLTDQFEGVDFASQAFGVNKIDEVEKELSDLGLRRTQLLREGNDAEAALITERIENERRQLRILNREQAIAIEKELADKVDAEDAILEIEANAAATSDKEAKAAAERDRLRRLERAKDIEDALDRELEIFSINFEKTAAKLKELGLRPDEVQDRFGEGFQAIIEKFADLEIDLSVKRLELERKFITDSEALQGALTESRLQQFELERVGRLEKLREQGFDEITAAEILEKQKTLIQRAGDVERLALDAEIAALRAQRNIADEFDLAEELLNIDRERVEQNLALIKQGNDDEIAEAERLQTELARINDEIAQNNNDRADQEAADRRERVDQIVSDLTLAVQSFSQVLDGIAQLSQVNTDNKIKEFDARIDASEKRVEELTQKKEKASGKEKQILQRQINAEQAILEQQEVDKQKLLKEEFARQKAFKIALAIASTALAVVNALTTVPYPAALIAAAAAAIAGGLQVAAIAATTFAKGGLIGDIDGMLSNYANAFNNKFASGGGVFPAKRGGMIRGPSHSQGGVKFKLGGGGLAEAEGGEYITSRKATGMFFPVIDFLNNFANANAAMRVPKAHFKAGGGIPKFQAGGVVPETPREITAAFNDRIDELISVTVDKQIVFSQTDFREAENELKFVEQAEDL